MAYMTDKPCLCCGDIMRGVNDIYGEYDPYCSYGCKQRAKFNKCKLSEAMGKLLAQMKNQQEGS